MHVIRPAERGEVRAALGVLLARPNMDPGELHRQIDTLIRYASRQNLSLKHCLVAEEGGRIETACLCVDAPGRMASVFIPNQVPTPAHADTVVSLLQETVCRAESRGVRLVQGVIAPEAVLERDLFARAGFKRLTELIYLERDVVEPVPRTRSYPPLTWEEYSVHAHREFARVVQETYTGSLDCAALSGVRDIEDTLASQRA
ncbi:MAG: hypothetical protein WBL15_13925, partial [Phycisphaerae bacterium]